MPITYIIILIIIAIFLLFFLYIEPMLAKNKIKNNNEHGSARFANFKEIRRDFKKESISNINKAALHKDRDAGILETTGLRDRVSICSDVEDVTL